MRAIVLRPRFDSRSRFRPNPIFGAMTVAAVHLFALTAIGTLGAISDDEKELVLARASDPARPKIKVDDELVEVQYRGYLIREGAAGWLRAHRERKSVESPPWPSESLDGMLEFTMSSGGSSRRREDWNIV